MSARLIILMTLAPAVALEAVLAVLALTVGGAALIALAMAGSREQAYRGTELGGA